jgi:uncharacterized protein YndB with AHSA1/START domain
MQFELSTVIAAPAERVFALYANVSQWPQWDPDLKSASIDGAFASGAKGVVAPHGGPKSNVVFMNVIPNRSFTVSCKLPLCEMRFEHELVEVDGGTRATHRTVFEGLLAPLFGRLIGSGMRKTLPNALAGLKALAERKTPSTHAAG